MKRGKVRRRRIMPVPLQIRMFKDRFLKYNIDREEDLVALWDDLNPEDHIDSSLTYRENLNNLKIHFPEYKWDKP